MKNDKQNFENMIDQTASAIHSILFKSYSVFLFAVILGIVFDMFIHFDIFKNAFYQYLGLIMLFFGSYITYWAQSTSGNYKEEKAKKNNKTFFDRGPYKYLRSPTHFGLFIMTLGFAIMINSLFSIIFTILAHAITKVFFVGKQEKILEIKYGEIYRDYKKKVKNWL